MAGGMAAYVLKPAMDNQQLDANVAQVAYGFTARTTASRRNGLLHKANQHSRLSAVAG